MTENRQPDWVDPLFAWLDSPGGPEPLDALIGSLKRRLAVLEAMKAHLCGRAANSADDAEEVPEPPHHSAPKPAAKTVAKPSAPSVTVTEARNALAAILREQGPKRAEALRNLAGLSVGTFNRAIAHEWFERDADGYHLSSAAFCLLREPEVERVEPDGEAGD